MTVALNMALNQGETYIHTLTWKTGDPALPVDLTGYTARMMARTAIADASPIINLTSAGGDIVLGGVLGTIVITITASVTAALTAAMFPAVYDLEMVNGAVVTRLCAGTMTLSLEVTR